MSYRKIILRARQNHLLDRFREETKSLSPELIARLRSAWHVYVRDQVGKGLRESDKPQLGQEESHWPRIVELTQNGGWKQECLKRDEKFDMRFSTAVGTYILHPQP